MVDFSDKQHRVKIGLAEMLKGGVIMDVTNAQQASIAEQSGAVAVMALERVPSDIRADGGVARMADPDVIDSIKKEVSIPVMAKCRIGHFAEAHVLEALEVDFIDESEVLTPADYKHHVDKWPFKVPFVCGCRNLGEALRRISEGAAMIRTKGEAGTGDVSEAVKHLREIGSAMKTLTVMPDEELYGVAKEHRVSIDLVRMVAKTGVLPVPNFAAGGIATPADASLCMYLGAEAVFVGSGIFKSDNPEARAKAIVAAATHYKDAAIVADASRGLGDAMKGMQVDSIPDEELLHTR
ncbi:MAG: pyridoxal 5'-phosphate synthase lyase subunit PdxS [candidate division Zixibacteria bacterium]|nr:pyridoxal 5'-phosphate synthase lyase subunit PdxS [candidate division Zixibacteria bacterium]MDH3936214.1 pyridoxal 5'-phosphate synthase lyase subunit PdxS [candidate division Zixibacteria bacterium]